MPIAFVDATSGSAGFGTTVSATVDAGSAADRYLIGGGLSVDSAPKTHVSFTANGDATVQVGTTSNDPNSPQEVDNSQWGLASPDAGSQTVEVTFGNGIDIVGAVIAAVYSGVNQAAPIGTVYENFANITVSGQSVSATVADALAGDKIVAIVAGQVAAGSGTTISGGTVRELLADPPYALLEFTAGSNAPSISGVFTAGGSPNIYAGIRAFKLNPAQVPPVVVTQPADQAVSSGGQATFTVSATFSGSGPTYQWQDNRTGSFTNVADGTGDTTASYTTATAGQAFQGRLYRCVVSDSDGTTNSGSASLAVIGFPVHLWSTAVQSGNDVWLRDPTAFAAGAGLSVGVAVETDTALPLAARKLRAAGLASETDTALARTLARVKTTGLASEADTALALTLRKVASIGVSVETDSATARPLVKQRAAGLAVETDTAIANALRKARAVGRSDETDTALALSFAGSITVGRADETDTAQARALRKVLAVGVATEVESSQAIALRKAMPTAAAVETDSAQAVSLRKVGTVGRANESDQALTLTLIGPLQVGVAEEADAALAPQVRKVVTVSAATEADTALAVALVKRMAVGPSLETDTAIALAFAQPFVVRRADETDTALALSFVAGVPALPTAGAHASIRPKRGRARSMPAWLREKEPDKTRAVDEAAPADHAAQTRLAQAAAMREAAERLLSDAD